MHAPALSWGRVANLMAMTVRSVATPRWGWEAGRPRRSASPGRGPSPARPRPTLRATRRRPRVRARRGRGPRNLDRGDGRMRDERRRRADRIRRGLGPGLRPRRRSRGRRRGLELLHRFPVAPPGVALVAEHQRGRLREQGGSAPGGGGPLHRVERPERPVAEPDQASHLVVHQGLAERDRILAIGAVDRGPPLAEVGREPQEIERPRRLRPVRPGLQRGEQTGPRAQEQPDARRVRPEPARGEARTGSLESLAATVAVSTARSWSQASAARRRDYSSSS